MRHLIDWFPGFLAGGAGTRLGVLSEQRAKPAVPFAGRFRIIDFTLSNCVNSGIYDVAVLTQYLPRSLNDHIGIGRPWDLDRSFTGGVRLLQPFQGRQDTDWYAGTADAVTQNINFIRRGGARNILILSGDHIYQMDYDMLVKFHEAQEAAATVCVICVPLHEAPRYGIMAADEQNRIVDFVEKPPVPPGDLANMGVYVFRVDALIERLQALAPKHKDLDFGKHVIPSMLDRYTLQSYPFAGYWVDVGTVDAYWTTSMELISGHSQLNLYDPNWVIHTRSEERAPAKVGPQSRVLESMICNGSFVRGQVMRSVLSPGVYVSPGAVVRESVIMNDTWIGPGAVVDRCIVDKNRPTCIETSATVKANFAWHVTRAFHQAGRCTGCGECTRACPVGINMRLLNQSLARAAEEHFSYRAGTDRETPPIIGAYGLEDKESFIR